MKIDKLWGSRLKKEVAEGVLAFTSGRDTRCTEPYDERLIFYDVWGSKAHVIMLWTQGMISKKEVRALVQGLDEVEKLHRKGKFILDAAHEDVHSAIESYLIEHYGIESAGKLHTGRSRNDQVVVDMRLYLRAEVLEYLTLLLQLIDSLVEGARDHVATLMPGYTHHQPAMITSWGHLLFSYAVSLERDVARLVNWYVMFNYNPLGGAAGYGTALSLDRDLTARLMGFDGVHESSLDPSHNRWEPEAELCFNLSVMMNHLSSLAQTLLVLSTAEFGMVQLDDAYCTGSSLMPQKRNPDPLEVIKGKTSYVHGMVMALLSLGKSNFTGYNRDSQWSKYPVMDVIDECKPSLAVMREVIETLTFNTQAAYKQCERAFITSTDVVEWLVEKYHVPFREAKVVVERAVKYSERERSEKITTSALQRALKEVKIKVKISAKDLEQCQIPEYVVQRRKTEGGPSPHTVKRGITRLRKISQLRRTWLTENREKLERARAEVEKMVRSLG